MKARYTKTFFDFNKDNPTFLPTLINDFIDSDHSNKLIDMLKARFNFDEIGGETDSEFMRFFTDTYNCYKDYYIERLQNYEKTYDYAQGIIRSRNENYSNQNVNRSNSSHDNTTTETPDFTTTDFELPNRQTTNEYPTSKTKRGGSGTTRDAGSGSNSGSQNSSGSRSVTETYNERFLDLKEQFMKQIKSIYLEFANRFVDDFVQIYF